MKSYQELRDRILGTQTAIENQEKTAQKAQSALSANIDSQMKSNGTPLTGGDDKMRKELGDNMQAAGGKDNKDSGIAGKTDLPAAEILEGGVNKVNVNVTTKKTCSTEKKAKLLKAAQKLASLCSSQKVASEPKESILQSIHKQASLQGGANPVLRTYNESTKVVAAIAAQEMGEVLDGMDKRAQLTMEGKDDITKDLSPEDVKQLLQMAAMVPAEGEPMQQDEHDAILGAAPDEVIDDATGVVAGNEGSDEEMPQPTPEELAQLESVEGDLEGGDGGAAHEAGETLREETEEEKALKAAKGGKPAEKSASCNHQQQLLDFVCRGYRQGRIIEATEPPVGAVEFAHRKIAALQATVEGLCGVIQSQDSEIAGLTPLREKVASLEDAAKRVPTINAGKVDAIVATAVREGLVSGNETEIQNLKLAALSGTDGLIGLCNTVIGNAVSAKSNRLGSVQKVAAIRNDDTKNAESVDAKREQLRRSIID